MSQADETRGDLAVAETVAATIIHTDLVDSTKLSTSVAASEADRIRREHFRLLGEAVEANDGRMVKNLGDGIMAVFPGCSAALDAATAMQHAIVRHNRVDDGPDLSIRIGVSTGDCVTEDGDYFGEPVIQAARLCGAAQGGQILVAAVMGLLVPRSAHTLLPVGDLELKGIPEAFPTLELAWVPPERGAAGEGTMPLPARLAPGSGLSPLVGRIAERAVLEDALKAANAGERRAVVVTGEAGLGKTRLTSEFAAQAYGAGATVLYGRCDEELSVPYLAWVESLGHLVEHADDSLLAELDTGTLGPLARLLPQLRARLEGTGLVPGEAGDQYVLFGAVCRLLDAAASTRTLLVVLDDLHWADRGTLQLLEHVTTSLPLCRLLLVATYRETDLATDDPLTETSARLHRVSGVDRIGLVGLDDAEVLELLAGAAGHDLDADAVSLGHVLRNDTAGNPFFVVEMVRHLAETGAIARHDGRWRMESDLADLALPQSVRDVIGQRVRRLGEAVHAVLTAAAVVGREFDTDVVAGAAEIDADSVLDAVETAINAGLVAEVEGTVDRFSFTHALVQHSLYSELTGTRRARMHRRVADCLEALSSREPGELAKHLFAAVRPAELDRAIRYAIEAGKRATDAAAPDEAVRWYTQALEALDDGDPELRCEVKVALGDAERQAGRETYRERLLDAARDAMAQDRGDLLIEAALANYRGWNVSTGEVDEERVAVLDAALARPEASDADRARLLATLAGELTYTGDTRRFELAREAERLGHEVGDPAVLLDALERVAASINVPEMLGERRRRSHLAMELTADKRHPVLRYFALDQYADVCLASGDVDGALAGLEERTAIAERLGQPTFLWAVTHNRALFDCIAGDIDAAAAGNDRAFELGLAGGQPDLMNYFGGMLMQIHHHRGQYAEIVPLVRDRLEDNPGVSLLWAVLVDFLALAGDHEQSRELLEQAAADGFAFDRNVVWLASTAMTAEAAAVVGSLESAEVLHDRLVPFADQIVCSRVYCVGPVSFYLGVVEKALGRADEAAASYRDAIDRSRRIRSPFYVARSSLGLAEVLRPTDPAEAMSLRDEAAALAEQYGMSGVAAGAAAFLPDG